MLQAAPDNPVFYNSALEEWFVPYFIPDSAVKTGRDQGNQLKSNLGYDTYYL